MLELYKESGNPGDRSSPFFSTWSEVDFLSEPGEESTSALLRGHRCGFEYVVRNYYLLMNLGFVMRGSKAITHRNLLPGGKLPPDFWVWTLETYHASCH